MMNNEITARLDAVKEKLSELNGEVTRRCDAATTKEEVLCCVLHSRLIMEDITFLDTLSEAYSCGYLGSIMHLHLHKRIDIETSFLKRYAPVRFQFQVSDENAPLSSVIDFVCRQRDYMTWQDLINPETPTVLTRYFDELSIRDFTELLLYANLFGECRGHIFLGMVRKLNTVADFKESYNYSSTKLCAGQQKDIDNYAKAFADVVGERLTDAALITIDSVDCLISDIQSCQAQLSSLRTNAMAYEGKLTALNADMDIKFKSSDERSGINMAIVAALLLFIILGVIYILHK